MSQLNNDSWCRHFTPSHIYGPCFGLKPKVGPVRVSDWYEFRDPQPRLNWPSPNLRDDNHQSIPKQNISHYQWRFDHSAHLSMQFSSHYFSPMMNNYIDSLLIVSLSSTVIWVCRQFWDSIFRPNLPIRK